MSGTALFTFNNGDKINTIVKWLMIFFVNECNIEDVGSMGKIF
jgi:hypothetical protein